MVNAGRIAGQGGMLSFGHSAYFGIGTFATIHAMNALGGEGLLRAGAVTLLGGAAIMLALVPVDHLHGHVAANFLAPAPMEPPFHCLIASGGHTLLTRVEDHASFTVLGT